MMNVTRRRFISQSALTLTFACMLHPPRARAAGCCGVKVGACVVGLEDAKEAGLDGVQVSVDNAADILDIAKPAAQERYKAQMQSIGLPICSFTMGLLNNYPLATDPRGLAWLEQSIDAAKELGVDNVLVAFFGKGDLQNGKKIKEEAFSLVVNRLKKAAPRAKDAGVSLALENFLSAEQNLRLVDGIGHDSISIYYDVCNTGMTQGYDSPAEIRRLKGLISQVHYKNKSADLSKPAYLDEDKSYFESVTAALKDINYSGWVVIEGSCPSKNRIADAKRNCDFVRSLFKS